MWIQKYRPIHIKDIILDDYVKDKLSSIVKQNDIRGLILVGGTGVGKSSILECLSHDVYGRNEDEYVIKFNSSIDKNIKSLQETLDMFCKKKVSDISHNKMIIVDDIDYVPQKMQNVFASIMTQYPNSIFVFSCHTLNDIVEIIQSHCTILRIDRLRNEQIYNYLEDLCNKEKCHYTKEALERISFVSQGDLRKAINELQIIGESYNDITIKNINKLCDLPDYDTLQEIINMCIKKDIKNALLKIYELSESGYNGMDILSGMFDVLKDISCQINDDTKIPMMQIIGKTMYTMEKNIDGILQVEKSIIKICSL